MTPGLKNLLLATHRGDEPAARVLWNTQAPRLLHYARAIVVSAAEAEDVVQNVFCRILQAPRREVERVNDPAAWMAQLVRRVSINHLRSARRESARRAAVGGLRMARAGRQDEPLADDDLHRAIQRLPRRMREVIVLKHVAGLTFDQIAEATGLNRNTAAARYRGAIATLKGQLMLQEGSDRTGRVDAVERTRAVRLVQEVRHVG